MECYMLEHETIAIAACGVVQEGYLEILWKLFLKNKICIKI
jgi:hypothetical protein